MTDDTFDLIGWLGTGTIGQREVVLHNEPGLVVEFERLDAERTRLLRESAEDPEATLADESDPSRIDAEIEALYDQWEASKSTWTVRALTDAELRAIHERIPMPDGPREPKEPKGSPKASQAWGEFRKSVAEYKVALEKHLGVITEIQDERNLHTIAASVQRVETSAGSVDGVTYEQIKALREGPYGKVRTEKLLAAISELTTAEPVIPAPKSRAPQRSTRG